MSNLPTLMWPSITADRPKQAAVAFDYILRVQNTAKDLIIGGVHTHVFADAMQKHVGRAVHASHEGCWVLGRVIDQLKRRERYNVCYRDYLVGNLTEDEFEAAAERYTYTIQVMDTEALGRQVSTLLTYTTEEFTANEVAEIFNVSDEAIKQVTQQLSLPLPKQADASA